MGLVLVTPPAEEPIDTAALLEHVRELDTDQAEYVTALAIAAREHCESRTRRAFLTQTWKLTLDAFPRANATRFATDTFANARLGLGGGDGPIRLPRNPVQSVTSVQYRGLDGALTTLDPSMYQVDLTSLPARIVPAYATSWPSTRQMLAAVEVVFVAGWDTPDNVPAGIKQAIRFLTGHWYDKREPVITGTIASDLAFTLDAVLGPHIVAEA